MNNKKEYIKLIIISLIIGLISTEFGLGILGFLITTIVTSIILIKSKLIINKFHIFLTLIVLNISFSLKLYGSLFYLINKSTEFYNKEMGTLISNYEYIKILISNNLLFENTQVLVLIITSIITLIISISLGYITIKNYKKLKIIKKHSKLK